MAKHLIISKAGAVAQYNITLEDADRLLTKWAETKCSVQIFARECRIGPEKGQFFFICEAFRNCVCAIVTDGERVAICHLFPYATFHTKERDEAEQRRVARDMNEEIVVNLLNKMLTEFGKDRVTSASSTSASSSSASSGTSARLHIVLCHGYPREKGQDFIRLTTYLDREWIPLQTGATEIRMLMGMLWYDIYALHYHVALVFLYNCCSLGVFCTQTRSSTNSSSPPRR